MAVTWKQMLAMVAVQVVGGFLLFLAWEHFDRLRHKRAGTTPSLNTPTTGT